MWNNARVSSRVAARVRKHRFYQRDSAMCLREKSIYNASPRGLIFPRNRKTEQKKTEIRTSNKKSEIDRCYFERLLIACFYFEQRIINVRQKIVTTENNGNWIVLCRKEPFHECSKFRYESWKIKIVERIELQIFMYHNKTEDYPAIYIFSYLRKKRENISSNSS